MSARIVPSCSSARAGKEPPTSLATSGDAVCRWAQLVVDFSAHSSSISFPRPLLLSTDLFDVSRPFFFRITSFTENILRKLQRCRNDGLVVELKCPSTSGCLQHVTRERQARSDRAASARPRTIYRGYRAAECYTVTDRATADKQSSCANAIAAAHARGTSSKDL